MKMKPEGVRGVSTVDPVPNVIRLSKVQASKDQKDGTTVSIEQSDKTQASREDSQVAGSSAASAQASAARDLRLVVERDKGSGSFVYKALDAITGEVIRQMPREDVLKMRADPNYKAGDLVRAKA
ncbi:MAG: flagellar protein FlaG [Asticcacaulis sp.]